MSSTSLSQSTEARSLSDECSASAGSFDCHELIVSKLTFSFNK